MLFERIKIEQRLIDFLGAMPGVTQQCLILAFEKIKAGTARLSDDAIFPHLQAAQYCDYTILISITPDGETAVIVDIVPERNFLSGLF